MRSWIVFSRTEVWCIKAAWEEATLPPLAPSEINIAGTSENHLIPLPSWHRWQIPDSACLFKNNFYLMITAPQGCTAPYWNMLQICSQQLSANAANIIRVFFCPLLYHQKNAKSRSDNFFLFYCQCNNQPKKFSNCRGKWIDLKSPTFCLFFIVFGHSERRLFCAGQWGEGHFPRKGERLPSAKASPSSADRYCHRVARYVSAPHMRVTLHSWQQTTWNFPSDVDGIKKKIIYMKITLSFTMQILEGKLVN